MKRRKFAEGGEFELSDEAKASGLRIGRNERISDEVRAAAIDENTGPGSKGFKRLSDKEAADMMGREVNMPEAVAIPVPAPRRITPRALDEGSPEVYTAPKSTVAAPARPTAPAPARVPAPRPIPPQNPDLPNAASRPRQDDYYGGPLITPKAESPSRRQLDRKKALKQHAPLHTIPMKKGGAVKASKRGDGIAQRGKTKGRML